MVRGTTDYHPCYIGHFPEVISFVLILCAPVNNFSVMSGRDLLGQPSTNQRIKCLDQGHFLYLVGRNSGRT